MVSSKWLGLCVLALMIVPASASADDPPATVAQKRVEKGLVEPLAQKESARSKFSRALIAPQERRVRVTQDAPSIDASGHAYMAFAIDSRRGTTWQENEIVGCAYTQSGALFVKRGTEFRPADILLGKDVDAVAGVCAPGKARS